MIINYDRDTASIKDATPSHFDGGRPLARRLACILNTRVSNRTYTCTMSDCERQFEDANAPASAIYSGVVTNEGLGAAPSGGPSEESESLDSDEEWDTLYGDDDLCADFEEETKDFTKKLNAARGAGGFPSGQGNKKGAPLDKTGSAMQLPKSIQVNNMLMSS